MKKFISFILSICLIYSMFGISSYAFDSNSINDNFEKVADELYAFANCKDLINLSGINFSELYIEEPINIYSYKNNTINKIGYAYFVCLNNSIANVVYEHNDSYQIMTTLGTTLKNLEIPEKCAIIYDSFGCYLFDGIEFSTLCEFESIDSFESSIITAPQTKKSEIIIKTRSKKYQLTSNNLMSRGAFDYSYCNINYVSQKPYNNLCWAACIAMINNYINNTSLTAKIVAQNYYNSTSNFNKSLNPTKIVKCMNNTYNLGYTYHTYAPNDSVISSNIKKGYPIIGGFSLDNQFHAVVIYGSNLIDGKIVIMDPANGSITCSIKNGSYSYTYPGTSDVLTLTKAIAKYW